MALVRNFVAETSEANSISITWNHPVDFNNTTDEIIVTRTITHFPMELFNSSFPDTATDPRGIEVFRGSTIAGTDTGTISVSGSILTDTGATFPTTPPLNGRLLRDTTSKVFRILSNTATTVTVDGTPADGKYIILPDFPCITRTQENFEIDIRTEVGIGFIKNLVKVVDNSLQVVTFDQDELTNLIFKDGAGDLFVIKSNTSDTVFFQESALTPVIGAGMAILNSFNDSQPLPYIDTFKTDAEADARIGTGLRDNQFYYYTAFSKPATTNVAQVDFSTFGNPNSTQDSAISVQDRDFGGVLYQSWPSLHRELDETGDLEDSMDIFGFQFNELHALIDTYNLQNTHTVFVNALLPLSEQTGLPSIGFSISAHTLRRVACDWLSAVKLKGSKEGIFLFIKILTTWDITDGTADFAGAISDFLPNVEALRFFDPNLGTTNTRLTTTDPFIAGGRFATSLPGIVIPGFFTFREFVVDLPDVALFIGRSDSFNVSSGNTIMEDTSQNFGPDDSLIGNFLLPNQEEVNDIFEIIANTSTTITVRGIINNTNPGGDYAILSPLNTSRFIILNKFMPVYQPFGTRAGFRFV